MILKKIIIKNFYCFLNENEFDFAEGLNIISAQNSGGKSQLFNAFYWTFFDKVYLDKTDQAGKKEWRSGNSIIACPDYYKTNSSTGDKIKTEIKIELNDEFYENDEPKGEIVTYTFEKTAVYEKTATSFLFHNRPELKISFVKDGETNFIPESMHSYFLEKIFPTSIRKFMWFQGETMENLYDFSNPSTLKNAIREISYFPIYDNIEKIVKASANSIADKIQKELKQQNRLNQSQLDNNYKIQEYTNKIETKEEAIKHLINSNDQLRDRIATVEQDLKGYDKYRDIKQNLSTLQSDLNSTLERIDDADKYIKETLINKWMLNDTELLISAADDNLKIILSEIQSFQQSNNPVPMSLPGPEYIAEMLKDHICYICEREVLEDTAPYEALKKRLDDFETDANFKILQENYTDLNRLRKTLVKDLKSIKEEILEENKKRDTLIKHRNSINRKIKNIYEESGLDSTNIQSGSTTASQLFTKLQTYNSELNKNNNNIKFIENELNKIKESLELLKIERVKFVRNSGPVLIESVAEDYIKLFVKAIGKLSVTAYSSLIEKIQEESNKLYSLYMGGNNAGKIVIENGVKIIDKTTNEILMEIATADTVAQKLAVAFAFLSLSETKQKKSYPIIADAPTSDFDEDNTYNLTLNISGSFNQIIIMSKDYMKLTSEEKNELIRKAKVVKFYELKNELIDKSGSDSRTNKKTFITKFI